MGRAWVFAVLLAGWVPQFAVADAVVLMYHRFGEDRYPSTSVRIEQFEAHLDYLAREGYAVWPLERVLDYRAAGREIPDRTVAITVDDAYRSVYEVAYPSLRARGWPFTVFVATGPVDKGLAGYMTWDQMRAMAAGGVAFANHGVTHDYLLRRKPGETDAAWRERMKWEIGQAAERLRAELGASPRWFAYPYGEYDAALAELATGLGYVGFGQQSGAVGRWSDERALPRFPMAEAFADLSQFAEKVRTLSLPVRRVEPWDPVVGGENPPRLVVELAEPLPRIGELACYVSGQEKPEIGLMAAAPPRFSVQARRPLPAGRSRYNCTVPGPEGRYYWYSHPWLVTGEP